MAYTTAQLIAKLKTVRDQIVDQLVDLTENPKPTYNIDGEMVAWGDLFSRLSERLDKTEAMIQAKDPGFHQTQYFT